MISSVQLNSLQEKFVTTLRNTFGAAGENLLRELPSIVDECKIIWGLELFDHFPNLSYNYVAPGVRRDGTQVVLKIGVADNKELLTEIETLRIFSGRGMVRLIEARPEKGAFLLERILPGVSLKDERDDSNATRIAAQLMRRLPRVVPERHSFPTVAEWFEGFQRLRKRFDGGSGPFPERLIALAEEFAAQLLASSSTEVLLHGDLHQDNILFSDRLGWLAIDPKGVVGEPCYEVAAFLRNPSTLFADASLALAASERRLNIFSEVLGYDRERMTKWAVTQSVLSACWSLEDSDGDWGSDLSCAETFVSLLSNGNA